MNFFYKTAGKNYKSQVAPYDSLVFYPSTFSMNNKEYNRFQTVQDPAKWTMPESEVGKTFPPVQHRSSTKGAHSTFSQSNYNYEPQHGMTAEQKRNLALGVTGIVALTAGVGTSAYILHKNMQKKKRQESFEQEMAQKKEQIKKEREAREKFFAERNFGSPVNTKYNRKNTFN